MSEVEDSDLLGKANAYLALIEEQVRRAESEIKEGEQMLVVAWTPEGSIEAIQFDCLEPNLMVIHGRRSGRRTTLIAQLSTLHVAIETFPLPPEEQPRLLGFRVVD